jgi:2-polyprenyl-3-methyl-5-hydroxy-6-metoxy-1,4-benzoquinol methylase
MIAKSKYLVWSLARIAGADTSCPGCSGQRTRLVRRKYSTALYVCPSCKLMFRVPKDDPKTATAFYESEYEQGFTTDCPSPEELEKLKNTRFAGTEKDYSVYISFLQAAGIKAGMSIFDFGCSWGYGSWQLRQAGYDVYSYEIAPTRAHYAESMLGCKLISPQYAGKLFDCFFSAHVLEHLNSPREMWRIAREVLRPHGAVVSFLPNGNLTRPKVHKTWGKVHPLLIGSDALLNMAWSIDFSGVTYTTPYDLQEVCGGAQGSGLSGTELAIVARKAVHPDLSFSAHKPEAPPQLPVRSP